jgi:hypothetical protein
MREMMRIGEVREMERNRIGIIIAAVVVVLLLIWLFVGIGDDEAVVTTEDGDAAVVETD